VIREELLEQDISEVDTTTPTPSPHKSKARSEKKDGRKAYTKDTQEYSRVHQRQPRYISCEGTGKATLSTQPSPTVAETSSSADIVVQHQKELAALKNNLESNQAEAGRYIMP